MLNGDARNSTKDAVVTSEGFIPAQYRKYNSFKKEKGDTPIAHSCKFARSIPVQIPIVRNGNILTAR